MPTTRQETSRGFSASDSSTSSLSNSTTETTLFQETIKAGKMGTVKTLNFWILCDLTTLAVVPNVTIKVKLGTASLTVVNGMGIALNQTNKPFIIEGRIKNKDSASAQIVYAKVTQNASNIPMLLAGSAAMETTTWTQDTSTDKTFSITAQFSSALSSTVLRYNMAELELT